MARLTSEVVLPNVHRCWCYDVEACEVWIIVIQLPSWNNPLSSTTQSHPAWYGAAASVVRHCKALMGHGYGATSPPCAKNGWGILSLDILSLVYLANMQKGVGWCQMLPRYVHNKIDMCLVINRIAAFPNLRVCKAQRHLEVAVCRVQGNKPCLYPSAAEPACRKLVKKCDLYIGNSTLPISLRFWMILVTL